MLQAKTKTEFNYKKCYLVALLVFVCVFTTACLGKKPPKEETPVADFNQDHPSVEIEVSDDTDKKPLNESKMVSYDVTTIGRNDPFAPKAELDAYAQARNSAIAEANARNAEIARIKRLKGKTIREADDINPYNFNLPTPPTSLASERSAAAKITKTKVVGIMYNRNNPSAILNIDDKDYLVRQGDKIVGQEFKVIQINPNWITVGLGSNVYSASIGELFSKDVIDNSTNDLYNLKNRFGGRRS